MGNVNTHTERRSAAMKWWALLTNYQRQGYKCVTGGMIQVVYERLEKAKRQAEPEYCPECASDTLHYHGRGEYGDTWLKCGTCGWDNIPSI